jgi:hypothetical protein
MVEVGTGAIKKPLAGGMPGPPVKESGNPSGALLYPLLHPGFLRESKGNGSRERCVPVIVRLSGIRKKITQGGPGDAAL